MSIFLTLCVLTVYLSVCDGFVSSVSLRISPPKSNLCECVSTRRLRSCLSTSFYALRRNITCAYDALCHCVRRCKMCPSLCLLLCLPLRLCYTVMSRSYVPIRNFAVAVVHRRLPIVLLYGAVCSSSTQNILLLHPLSRPYPHTKQGSQLFCR